MPEDNCVTVLIHIYMLIAAYPWDRMPRKEDYPADAHVVDVLDFNGAKVLFRVLIASESFPKREIGEEYPAWEGISESLLDEAREICRERGWLPSMPSTGRP